MENSFHQIRVQAKRLQRYGQRAKDKIWSGSRQDLINALADVAEAGEIARRLYNHIQNIIKERSDIQD